MAKPSKPTPLCSQVRVLTGVQDRSSTAASSTGTTVGNAGSLLNAHQSLPRTVTRRQAVVHLLIKRREIHTSAVNLPNSPRCQQEPFQGQQRCFHRSHLPTHPFLRAASQEEGRYLCRVPGKAGLAAIAEPGTSISPPPPSAARRGSSAAAFHSQARCPFPRSVMARAEVLP